MPCRVTDKRRHKKVKKQPWLAFCADLPTEQENTQPALQTPLTNGKIPIFQLLSQLSFHLSVHLRPYTPPSFLKWKKFRWLFILLTVTKPRSWWLIQTVSVKIYPLWKRRGLIGWKQTLFFIKDKHVDRLVTSRVIMFRLSTAVALCNALSFCPILCSN